MSTTRTRRMLVAVGMSVCALLLVASSSKSVAALPSGAAWPQPIGPTTRMVLVGDSLAQEAAPLIEQFTAPMLQEPKFWPGTAPCDWTNQDLDVDRSTVVVISFTGNSLTSCMSDGAGGFLDGEAFAAAYESALLNLITTSRASGGVVVLVGQPYRAPSFGHDGRVDAVNAMMQRFANEWRYVAYVDAGASVETADGHYARRVPCLSYDTNCGPDGRTTVRSPDGVHFCPTTQVGLCPGYSSGARRFALAVAAAANNPSAFD